ncbi:alpha/beta fold hydrolase [Paenibacillus elgii]|uniref:alpha/beta fold hydrolase n=1 Tax=Paenibacillus elgii TaxID=189691 RepID=UPI000248DBEB|nr:alpha/beta hydrolase [Paenibacillus elgii]
MTTEKTNPPLYYETLGEGYPLIVLHALATDHRSMMAWMEPLFERRPGWKRIYVDIPAHGRSPVEPWMKTSDDLLSVLLDGLRIILPGHERFALMGMSFGGYMAQGIWRAEHRRADGLCLLAPALHRKTRTLPERSVPVRDEALLAELEPEVRAAFETLATVQTRANWELFREEWQPGRLLADRAFLSSDWRTQGYHFQCDPIPEDSRFPQPTLFLLGRQDAICGYRDHFAVLESFPRATFAVLNGTGHLLQIEQRKLVQHHVGLWLDAVEQEKLAGADV